MGLSKLILFAILFTSDLVKSTNVEKIRIDHGKLMQSYMHRWVDPCTDFYKYACGNWAKSYRISADQLRFDALDILTNKVNKFFKDAVLFNNITSPLNDDVKKFLATSEIQSIKSYYFLCRNQKSVRYQPYIRTLNFPGGWPVLNRTWSDQHFDWLNMTAQLKLFNVASLFNVMVAPHYQNTTRNSIYILPAELAFLHKDNYLRDGNMVEQVMIEALKFVFQRLGIQRRKIFKITKRLVEFETKLASIYPEDDSKESDEVEELTLETLGQLLPEIDFKRYLQIVCEKEFSGSQEVLILARSYFTRLIKLLNETDNEVLANYLFTEFIGAIEIDHEKEAECTDEIVTYFGFALGHIYNMAFNNERNNKDVEMIGKNIRTTFKKSIEDTPWIDQDIKKEASAKLENLIMIVGGPSSFDAYEMIKKELLDIDLDLESYYKIFFKLNAYTVRKTFKNLDKLKKKHDIDVNTATVNAFYDRTKNQIFIPTNILQPPIYEYHLPYSVKYGALGSIIGHEITHSLDATGSEFDSNGTVREWWSGIASEEYVKRTQCLESQYANYMPYIANLLSENIKTDNLDENIADNGGLRHSYQAYQNWLLANTDMNETLPHLNLTNTQLFFLSFAQFYCQKISKVGILISLFTDEHAINGNRVIGALSNFEKFAEDFNCPVGSKMNPTKRCRVW